MHRLFVVLIGFGLFSAAACSSTDPTPANPVLPAAPPTASLTGTWTGNATDSSGSTLGMASGTGMMTWQLTQNNNQVTGVLSVNGIALAGNPTISGTMSGAVFNFTVSVPQGVLPSGICSDAASGSMTLDGTTNTMTGTYSGTNSCMGPFGSGQITLTRQ